MVGCRPGETNQPGNESSLDHLPFPTHHSNIPTMPKDAAPEQMPELGLDALFGVKGKIAVITGAGTGIGKMMAAAYVRNGAKKVYIASRKLDDLKKVAEQLSALSPNKGGE